MPYSANKANAQWRTRPKKVNAQWRTTSICPSLSLSTSLLSLDVLGCLVYYIVIILLYYIITISLSYSKFEDTHGRHTDGDKQGHTNTDNNIVMMMMLSVTILLILIMMIRITRNMMITIMMVSS